MYKTKKLVTKMITALLLLGLVVIAGNFAEASTSKTVRNKMSNYGSLIDQTSICDTGSGAGSQTIYKCTQNGSNKTKFIFNVMSWKNKNLQRHLDAYLRVNNDEKEKHESRKEDFGYSIAVDEKGAGEMGSYIQVLVGGNFAAGITLAGY